MTNHYHLVLETADSNLSRGMRQLNVYTQRFNRRHTRVGYVDVRHQVFLGDERFVARFQDLKQPEALREIPRTQRQPLDKPLVQYQQAYPQRDEAMARAYRSSSYTMKEIGDFFGVHYMTVSRAVRKFETQQQRTGM